MSGKNKNMTKTMIEKNMLTKVAICLGLALMGYMGLKNVNKTETLVLTIKQLEK